MGIENQPRLKNAEKWRISAPHHPHRTKTVPTGTGLAQVTFYHIKVIFSIRNLFIFCMADKKMGIS